MNWHVESNYSPEWKELRFGTCLNQSISLDLFSFHKEGRKNRVLILVSETLCAWPLCHYDDTEVDLTWLPSAVVLNIGTFYRLFELRGSTVWWGDIFLCLSLFVFDFLWEKICHEATLQYLEGADIVIGGKVLFLLVFYTSIAIESFSKLRLLEVKFNYYMISKSQL